MDEANQNKHKRNNIMAGGLLLLILIVILAVTAYTFILQQSYTQIALKTEIERDISSADAVHKLVNDRLGRKDFTEIRSRSDENKDLYQNISEYLNEIRTLNSTRYIYTATRNEEGRLIYVVDGLDPDAGDIRHPGDYIEEEMVPYIEKALSGETIYSQDIIDTTWGPIFTACYPVTADDGTNEIVGAFCIEMDMQSTYGMVEKTNKLSVMMGSIAVCVLVALGICGYWIYKKQKENEWKQRCMLKEAADQADSANKAKSTFLFNMSHDIRTPMNAILGFTELAKKNANNPQVLTDYLNKIQMSGKGLLSILDKVLEISRIESGKTTLEESPQEAGKVLDSCVVMMDPEIEKKHLIVTAKKEISTPYIYFDATRITEIILNILSNAIKYTADGGRIDCKLTQSPNLDEGWIYQELSIQDNGIGMSEEFQKHVFDLFVREHSTTTSGIPGTGLGMGITKKLVDLMNGTITVQSKVGEGTTVTVKIPVRIATYEDTQPKHSKEFTEKERLQGKHILLAEDNDLNAEIAITLLEEEGLKVDRAIDGVECVKKLEYSAQGYYELILMDIQMPSMNGYQATEKIRQLSDKKKAEIPIIAMTANAFSEDKAKAISSGMNDHVAKPIDMDILVATMLKYV